MLAKGWLDTDVEDYTEKHQDKAVWERRGVKRREKGNKEMEGPRESKTEKSGALTSTEWGEKEAKNLFIANVGR